MRKFSIVSMLLGVLGSLLFAIPAQATGTGVNGCTPGYWKNHTSNWEEVAASTPLVNRGFDPDYTSASATFLQALRYQGGSTLAGAEQILLRAGAAAYLNAVHDDVGYPLTRVQINTMVNNAIDSGSRAKILEVAAYLDRLNNAGCPLN